MILLKVTEEYRAESELEVKEMSENFRREAAEKGYALKGIAYTKKEKKIKGEVAEGYLVKVTKVYGGMWDGLE